MIEKWLTPPTCPPPSARRSPRSTQELHPHHTTAITQWLKTLLSESPGPERRERSRSSRSLLPRRRPPRRRLLPRLQLQLKRQIKDMEMQKPRINQYVALAPWSPIDMWLCGKGESTQS